VKFEVKHQQETGRHNSEENNCHSCLRADRAAGVCADEQDDHRTNNDSYTTDNNNRNNHNLHCGYGNYL